MIYQEIRALVTEAARRANTLEEMIDLVSELWETAEARRREEVVECLIRIQNEKENTNDLITKNTILENENITLKKEIVNVKEQLNLSRDINVARLAPGAGFLNTPQHLNFTTLMERLMRMPGLAELRIVDGDWNELKKKLKNVN